MNYLVTDGTYAETIEAVTAQEAADKYVSEGDWGVENETVWVTVSVSELDATGEELRGERVTIAIDPDEPECEDGEGHDWQRPLEIVGGPDNNPGVYGDGGGVQITDVCMACGLKRVNDTWATNPVTGEQGLESVSYEEDFLTEDQRTPRSEDEES